ncbi:hypothetical protein B0H16DRAFT_1451515 [Mycena metata]|uniref:RNA-dependent RNA polymerase n=1 Tax=Mycena metata TaxID=1033252 RepID=A0AAD7JV66_9AGAR|nr:hypothetical protein B0H16DRAFT_1451515 [Mycena metata]
MIDWLHSSGESCTLLCLGDPGTQDLDGDTYFVIFNPLLIPKSRPPPPLRANAAGGMLRVRTVTIAGFTQTTPSPAMMNKHTNIRSDAIETFITMHCHSLVGEMSNQWSELVGATRALADLPQCKLLILLIETVLDAVKNGGGLSTVKDDFLRAKEQIRNLQASADWVRLTANWENPLQLLAERVPGKVPEEMEFVPNPQLILRSRTSEEEWQRLSLEAKQLMLGYNVRLNSTIKADKEIRAYGWEDEKRADVFKAEFIAEHFPAVEKLEGGIFDVPKYWLKVSVWYSVGYENCKQSFAWLGARYLNWIKAMSTGHVPIAVGGQSTPLVPPPKAPANNAGDTAISPPLGGGDVTRPPSPVLQPISRKDSEETLVDLDDDPDVSLFPGTLKPPMISELPSTDLARQFYRRDAAFLMVTWSRLITSPRDMMTIYHAHGSAASWEWLGMVAPCVTALRHLSISIINILGSDQGTKHAPPDLSTDIELLMNSLTEHEVYQIKGRVFAEGDGSPTPDVITVGIQQLTDSASNPLTEYNAAFLKLQARRRLRPLVSSWSDTDIAAAAANISSPSTTLPPAPSAATAIPSNDVVMSEPDEDSGPVKNPCWWIPPERGK